ncbi:hypothetical protein BOX15_Mlig018595g1, partial [Macrostomum lignano]
SRHHHHSQQQQRPNEPGLQRDHRSMSGGGGGHEPAASAGDSAVAQKQQQQHLTDLSAHASTPRRPWGHRRMHSCPTVPHQFGALSLVSLTPTAASRSPSLKQHHQPHHPHHQYYQKHRRLPSAHLPATSGVGSHAHLASLQPARRSSQPSKPSGPVDESSSPAVEEEEDDDEDAFADSSGPAGSAGTQCGWFCYRPACLQPLARPVPFAIAVIGLYFVQSFIVSGYINSINTTIELRYGLSTREIGYIYASYEVTCILATFLISYFGHGRNRAQLLGAGCLIIAIGYLLFAFPHFLGTSISNNVRNLTDGGPDGLCPASAAAAAAAAASASAVAALPVVELRPDCQVQNSALLILCISFALVGLGASPVYILAPTYLWDNVPQHSYPVYAASLHITSALGPACGFLGGAVFLSMYVNYPLEPPENLHSSHPLWTGAWWMGFLVFAGLAVLVAVPLLAFPTALPPARRAKRNNRRPDTAAAAAAAAVVDGDTPATAVTAVATPADLMMEPSAANGSAVRTVEIVMLETKQDKTASLSTTASSSSALSAGVRSGDGGSGSQPRIRDIPAGLARLFNNPLWLFISLLIVAEQSVVQAFVAYVNKYMQKSFGLPVTRSSIVTGLLVIPSAVIGIGAGAFFMRRFRPSSRAVSLTMMGLCVSTTLLTTGLVLCTCSNIQLAGLTAGYPAAVDPPKLVSSGASGLSDPVPPQLNATCNARCACSDANYDPVCDLATGVSYYSPCHAGCTNRTLRQQPKSTSPTTAAEAAAAAAAFASGINAAQWNYTACSCVPLQQPAGGLRNRHAGIGGGGIVSSGKCDNTCTTFVPFCILLFIIVLLTACGYEPCHILTLSCVSESDSSFALGMQNVLHRLLAFIPAPIYFGSLFDSTCLLRANDGSTCDRANGACTEYDLSRLPYMWIGVILALKLLGFLFASASYFSCRSAAATAERPAGAATDHAGGTAPADVEASSPAAAAADSPTV